MAALSSLDVSLLAEATDHGYDVATWRCLIESGDVVSSVYDPCANDALIAQLYQSGDVIPSREHNEAMSSSDERFAQEVATNIWLQDQLSLREFHEQEEKLSVDTFAPDGKIQVLNGILTYRCPHCASWCTTFVSEINCTIFTHGTTISGQVNPHIAPDVAAQLVTNGVTTAGCMLQYKLQSQPDGSYVVEKCSGL